MLGLGPLAIQVTEDDIRKAIPGNSSKCAVAQAIIASVPGAENVAVDIQSIRISKGNYRYIYFTPTIVQQYIVDFDAGESLEPFSFGLRRPGQIVPRQTVVKDENGKTIKKPSGRPKQRKPVKATMQVTPSRETDETTGEVRITRGPTPVKLGGKTPPLPKDKRGRPTTKRVYGIRGMRINQPPTAT